MDAALGGHQGTLAAGSTGRGIAPAAADKMYRHGIRLGDLLEPELLKEKLTKAFAFNVDILLNVFHVPVCLSFDEVYATCLELGKKLRPYITDTEVELYEAYRRGKKILFEGAQGMSLDPDHGVYPHTTSTNNVAGYAQVGSGLGFNQKSTVIGVVKAYMSRVGQSPLPTELLNETGQAIRTKGFEFGTTTGRPRRIGWLDLVQVKQSVRTSGLTDLAITKIDILSGFPELKVCIGYECDGQVLFDMPANLRIYKNAQPVYVTLRGWKDFTSEDVAYFVKNGFDSLPEALKVYVSFIEKETGCPATIISLGPERSQTIVRS